jgi:hypothetical protein
MSLFNPRIEIPVVSVVPNDDRTRVTISWPSQLGASGYRVYGGFDPLYIRSLISGIDPLPVTTTQFEFAVPFTPPTQIVYFWVAWVDSLGNKTFLDEVGSYAIKTSQSSSFTLSRYSEETQALYMIPDDQLYYFEEMRRRALAILDDVGESEEVDVFIRQWTGLPDKTAPDALGLDPDYQVMTRNLESFGTGFYPGFYPPLRIKMRFGALPNSLLDYQLPGMRPLLTNEAWTLWEPLLHEGDLVVRRSTGIRYVISSIAPSNKQGVPIVQRISLDVVTPTSPLQKMTDQLVRQKWETVNSVDFARLGFGIAADVAGGPDFLIF